MPRYGVPLARCVGASWIRHWRALFFIPLLMMCFVSVPKAAVTSSQVLVSSVTATPIVTNAGTSTDNRQYFVIINTDATITIYLGSSMVTSTTGAPLLAGQSCSIALLPGEIVYGLAASGSPVAAVLTENN